MKEAQGNSNKNIMTVPRSTLVNVLKDSIEKKENARIEELADILHSGMQASLAHASFIEELGRRFDSQHAEIAGMMEMMTAGFERMDGRFEDLIHQMDLRFKGVDKRFESVDKRFEDLIHQMDKRFDASERRHDDLIHQMDRRFDAIERRFTYHTWLIGIGFVALSSLIALLKIFA